MIGPWIGREREAAGRALCLAAALTFLGLRSVRSSLDLAPLVELFVLGPAAAVVYGASVLVLDQASDWGIQGDVRRVVAGVRS